MDADEVLSETAALAQSRVDNYVVDDDGNVALAEGAPEDAMAAVQSIKRRITTRTDRDGITTKTVDVELKLWDKPGSLKLMGKHRGIFADRVEVTGKDGAPLEVTRIERVIMDAQGGNAR